MDKKVNLASNFLGNKVYSYVFSLLEMNTSPKRYLISYIYKQDDNNYFYNLKTFHFSNFGLESSNFDSTTTSDSYGINYSNRIVSCFIMGEKIVVFLVSWDYSQYLLYIYNFNLVPFPGLPAIDSINNFNVGYGLFSKAYHIENNYAIFIYFTRPDSSYLKLKAGIIETANDDSHTQSFLKKIEQNLNSDNYNLNYLPLMNDFVKINSKRFIYLGLDGSTSTKLYIYIRFI